jgi:hypothetical protein
MSHLRGRGLALALVAGLAPLLAQSLEGLELLLLAGDLAGCLGLVHSGERDSGAGGGGGEVVALQRYKNDDRESD